jgi:putative DNA primase/helicase
MSGTTPRLPTDPTEFMRFHLALTRGRPDYKPHYLKVKAGNTVKRNEKGQPVHKETGNPVSESDPNRVNLGKRAVQLKHARITEVQAVKLLERGLNVGIEAETDDHWVIMDVDNPEVVKPSEVKPTLTTRSRKRAGFHYFYVATNPTDKRLKNLKIKGIGEIRSGNQYVLAPGSWVDTFDIPGIVPEDEAGNAGKYTLESDAPIASITFEEMPKAFRDAVETVIAKNTEGERAAAEGEARKAARKAAQPEGITGDEGSALFKLQLSDVITLPTTDTGALFKNPLHP